MKIYLFGNQDLDMDNRAFKVAEKLKTELLNIEFITVKPNEDLPFTSQERVVLMDTIMGIDKLTLITEKDLAKFQLPPRFSAHDFDLGFQLKYLKKLKKINAFMIIGLPMEKEADIKEVKTIIRRLPLCHSE